MLHGATHDPGLSSEDSKRFHDPHCLPQCGISQCLTGPGHAICLLQSSLVVAYIVEAYGLDALKATLRDLGKGIPINKALSTHTTAVEELDRLFVNWAKERASRLGRP